MLRVAIVGAGLIGSKRAAQMAGGKLVSVFDVNGPRAKDLASKYDAQVENSVESLVSRSDVDAVIVATTNDHLTPTAISALKAGKHVLIEKPAAKNSQELQSLKDQASKSKRVVGIGFNHRFHPAFQKAQALLGSQDYGPLMYIRARYGHGGRLGYEREWRADPKIAGGGELLDQGVHLIDLCRWIGGEFKLEVGRAKTFFWDMPVEDNGFMLLQSPDRKRSAFLHASCTEWKNLFDFEIFMKNAKLQIWGLGRSYGIEELRIYKMKPEMGPPDFESFTFPGEDQSWQLEFDAFLQEIGGKSSHLGRIDDAIAALGVVEETYRQSQGT